MAGAVYEPQIDSRGEGHKVLYGFGPPASVSDGLLGSPWAVGDVIINVAPSLGRPDRWRCTAAGTLGTWEAEMPDGYLEFAIPNAQVLTLFSVGSLLIPAQGAGSLIEVGSLVLENVFLTAAFAAGGAIQLSYGTGVTNPASATIAATFLTGPAANQVIKVGGVIGSTLAATLTNTGLYLTAATADYTTGAGSLRGKLTYRVHIGL